LHCTLVECTAGPSPADDYKGGLPANKARSPPAPGTAFLVHSVDQRSRLALTTTAFGKVRITAVDRLDGVGARLQLRGGEASRAARQLFRPEYRFPFHERDGFPSGGAPSSDLTTAVKVTGSP